MKSSTYLKTHVAFSWVFPISKENEDIWNQIIVAVPRKFTAYLTTVRLIWHFAIFYQFTANIEKYDLKLKEQIPWSSSSANKVYVVNPIKFQVVCPYGVSLCHMPQNFSNVLYMHNLETWLLQNLIAWLSRFSKNQRNHKSLSFSVLGTPCRLYLIFILLIRSMNYKPFDIIFIFRIDEHKK